MRLTKSEVNLNYWCVSLGGGETLPHVTIRIYVDDGPNDDAAFRREIEGMIVSAVNRDDAFDDLLAASQKLVVELSGWPVDKLHEIGGHTNAQVLFMRLNEAKAVIAKATPQNAARTQCTNKT